jgi:protocatechuate 3,4-dioxygenase beta subunit
VGELLRAQHRHPYRPAHLHFLGLKPGYQTLITQVFVDDDEHLESDVAFDFVFTAPVRVSPRLSETIWRSRS